MPIESVSHPADLATWEPEDPRFVPFYFELLGETSPVVDGSFAQLATAGAPSGQPVAPQASVYEYWWTIGHKGRPPGASGSRRDRWTGRAREDWIWDRLQKDHAASVMVFFSADRGWRTSEVAASVKYMSPVPHDPTVTERASSALTTVEPLLEDASKLVGLVQPAVGGVASKAAQSLDVLAQMKINQVPQVGGYAWAVSKITTISERGGVSFGVLWTLPGLMFKELGSRITGSLAVSFVPVSPQGQEGTLKAGKVRAHAAIHPRGGDQIWAPSQGTFIELDISPIVIHA